MTKPDGLAAARALWAIGDLSFMLWEQQKPIYNGVRALKGSVSEAVFLCARQFGKSYLGVILAAEDCIRYPNCCILIVGPTLKQTIGIVAPRLRDIARTAPPGLVQQQKSESKWIIGSSELVIGGMDINSSSQRGKTLQNVYVEEIVESNPDQYLESLRSDIGPALSHSKGGRICTLTTPPKISAHPFFLETMPKAEINNALYLYTIYDNKKLSRQQFIRCAELAGCKMNPDGTILEKSIDWLREYECKAVRDTRVTVVPDFDEALHVRPVALPPKYNCETWIDMGGTRDKTVSLLTCYSFHEDRLKVLDERSFTSNTATIKMLPDLYEMEQPHSQYLVKDNDGLIIGRWADCPGQIAVDLAALNYIVRLPMKQDWQAAINNLQVMFRQGKIEVDPKCKLLIATLKSGQFNKQRNDFARTEALGHCDAIATLMYAARCFDRSNPYPMQTPSKNTMGIVREIPLNQQMAKAIQPKNFMRRR